jgi:hypothetical protein
MGKNTKFGSRGLDAWYYAMWVVFIIVVVVTIKEGMYAA